jgi:hypothetical protein
MLIAVDDDDGSSGGNRRREARMLIVLCISGNSSTVSPSTRTSKATASTVIATGNLRLRQGRLLMADHGELCSATKPRQIEARGGYELLSYYNGGGKQGGCGLW